MSEAMDAVEPQSLWVWRNIPPPRATMRSIAVRVAEKHGLTWEQMLDRTRVRRVAWARQEAMYEMREIGMWSFPQIAIALNLKDHTTIIYGADAHERRMNGQPARPRPWESAR